MSFEFKIESANRYRRFEHIAESGVRKVGVRVNRGIDGQADRQTGSSSGALIRMSGFQSNIPGSFPTSGWYEMQIRRNIYL